MSQHLFGTGDRFATQSTMLTAVDGWGFTLRTDSWRTVPAVLSPHLPVCSRAEDPIRSVVPPKHQNVCGAEQRRRMVSRGLRGNFGTTRCGRIGRMIAVRRVAQSAVAAELAAKLPCIASNESCAGGVGQ